MRRGPGHEAALAEVVAALREAAAPDSAADGLAEAADPTIHVCAFCRLAERSAERSLRAFFAEFVNDPEVRVRFRKARGFCRAHTPLLSQCGDALGVAILYADLADETRKRWRTGAYRAGTKRTLLGRLRAGDHAGLCPACVTEAEAEERYVTALVDGLDRDTSLWQVIEQSLGLCVRHIERIASIAKPADAHRILEIESAKMDALFNELEAFVRKYDYRFRSDKWGTEKDSWRRALLQLRS